MGQKPEAFIAKNVTIGRGALIGGEGTSIMVSLKLEGVWNYDMAQVDNLTVVTTPEGLEALRDLITKCLEMDL